MAFELHPDLVRDGIDIGCLALCRILLIDDANYPWFVLVPERRNITDTIDLTEDDYAQLWAESRLFSRVIMNAFGGQKLNVAALGNMTPQLHVHHVVRYEDDPAWPGPIWGKHPLKPYSHRQVEEIKNKIKTSMCALPY